MKRFFFRLHKGIIAAAKFPIYVYRRASRGALPRCRFEPSCSQYGLEAIDEWGAVVGWILAVWRIMRCNPFGGHGYDPVPLRKRSKKKLQDGDAVTETP